jgi:hypothetical protein
MVAFRPHQVLEIARADHFELTVWASSRRIEARRLRA